MDRVILHSDLNNFYASVECLRHPELHGQPVVVGGDVEARHGVVLAKNEIAKRYGIKTGEALWQARSKCSPMVVVAPNHKLYEQYSKMARAIYLDYTGMVEPYGIDEAWLDVTGCHEDGGTLADCLRQRIFREMGITVSIGVSWNKIFAKLGSDIKKPNAVTVIDRNNYKDLVWPLPVSSLLYVGPATGKKLCYYGVDTIGKLAESAPDFLRHHLGKMGDVLHSYANGTDCSPVAEYDELLDVKSIGNSTTSYRDLVCDDDVKMVLFSLAEAVAARVRLQGLYASTLCISVRDINLDTFTRQCRITPSNLTAEYATAAMELFKRNYSWDRLPIRSIGLSVTDFSHDDRCIQLDMMTNQKHRETLEKLDGTLDGIRKRYGTGVVQRAVLLQDRQLTGADIKEKAGEVKKDDI